MSDNATIEKTDAVPSAPPELGAPIKRRRKKKTVKRIIACVVAVALVGGAAYGLNRLFTEDTVVMSPASTFVYRGSIQTTVNGTGVTRAKDSATIAPSSSGEVLEVFVSEGDWVNAGDPLYIINSSEAQSAVEKAQDAINAVNEQIAAVNAQLAELNVKAPFAGTVTNVYKLQVGDEVKQGTVLANIADDSSLLLTLYFSYAYENQIYAGQSANISIPSMMSEVAGTVKEVNYVRRISAEGTALFQVVLQIANPGMLTAEMGASASVSVPDGAAYPYEAGALEYARTAQIVAKASGKVVSAKLIDYLRVSGGQTLVTLSEDMTGDELKLLAAQLDAAQTALQKAKDTLGGFNAVAPMSGTVMSCSLVAGEIAEVGRAAVSIADTQSMIIDAQVDEMNVSFVKQGMFADVVQWGRNGEQHFMGVVDSVSLTGQYQNGISYFPALIRVDNPDGSLMPGMYVDYNLVASQAEDCLLVPLSAVKYTEAGTCLFVKLDAKPENALDAESMGIALPEGYYAVPIVIGLSNNSEAEIASGVEEGAEVFTQMVEGELDANGGGAKGGASFGDDMVAVRVG